MKPSINEAVAVAAVKEENGKYREYTLVDFKDCPQRLIRGILKSPKSQADGKYGVEILDKFDIPQVIEYFSETALGIPIEVQNDKLVVGVINWNSDFDAEEIEVYTNTDTDLDIETVHKSDIKRIKSWVVPQEQKQE